MCVPFRGGVGEPHTDVDPRTLSGSPDSVRRFPLSRAGREPALSRWSSATLPNRNVSPTTIPAGRACRRHNGLKRPAGRAGDRGDQTRFDGSPQPPGRAPPAPTFATIWPAHQRLAKGGQARPPVRQLRVAPSGFRRSRETLSGRAHKSRAGRRRRQPGGRQAQRAAPRGAEASGMEAP